MNPQPMLKLDNVTVELGGDVILKNINLEVLPQETLVMVGPSGGGKTVLLKTMAGVYHPTQGHAYCEGEDWQNVVTDERRRLAREIGVQFQKSGLFDSFTTYENLLFPLKEHFPDMSDADAEARIKPCLQAVDLWDVRQRMPHELSGGMQLRLCVARALVLQPKILFYDDPTAGLDPVNSDKMIELILKLKKEYGSTLVLTTHSMEIAYRFAGRIVLVCNQEVIETGSAEQTKNHPDPRVQQFIHGRLTGPLHWG